MTTRLTEKCFKGMNGAYAALFTPYDAKGRCKLIAHVGANCTDDSVLLAKHAAKVGIAKAGQARRG